MTAEESDAPVEPISETATDMEAIKQLGDLARQIYSDGKLIIPSDVEIEGKLTCKDHLQAQKTVGVKEWLVANHVEGKLLTSHHKGAILKESYYKIKSGEKCRGEGNICHSHHKDAYIRPRDEGYLQIHNADHGNRDDFIEFKFESI